NQAADRRLYGVWVHARPDISEPRQSQKRDARPECINAGRTFRLRREYINDEGDQPEAAFDNQRRRDGIPKSQAEYRVYARRERHVGRVTYEVERPMAQNGREEYP